MLRFWTAVMALALASLAAPPGEARGAYGADERNCNAAIDATQRNYEAALHTAQRAGMRERGKPGFQARIDAIVAVKNDYASFRAFKVHLGLDRIQLAAARRDYRAAVVARENAGSDREAAGRKFRAAVVALAAAVRRWDARLARCQSSSWAVAATGPSPKCAGMGNGAKCWNELADQPGCYVFDPYYNPPETATWSGVCQDGLAVGLGTWGWKDASDSGQATGNLVRGKAHGRWVQHSASGHVLEGPYVDGLPAGRWVERHADGTVAKGPFVDGLPAGRWVVRYADGTVAKGPFVDGQMHGRWVVRYADGTVAEETWRHGKAVD